MKIPGYRDAKPPVRRGSLCFSLRPDLRRVVWTLTGASISLTVSPAPPLLLVDVDGVLSLYGTGDGSRLGALVDGVPHLFSRDAATALRGLVDAFECVWCSGWEERADEHLPLLLDLPRGWPYV